MPEEFKPVVYACRQHSGFSFKGTNRWFRFEKHQLTLNKSADVADMDMHIETYPNIGRKVAKVELAQAEALVAAHIKSHGGAFQGKFTAEHGNAGDLNRIQNRDASLSHLSPVQESALRDELAENSALLTTKPVVQPEISKPAVVSVKPKIVLK